MPFAASSAPLKPSGKNQFWKCRKEEGNWHILVVGTPAEVIGAEVVVEGDFRALLLQQSLTASGKNLCWPSFSIGHFLQVDISRYLGSETTRDLIYVTSGDENR